MVDLLLWFIKSKVVSIAQHNAQGVQPRMFRTSKHGHIGLGLTVDPMPRHNQMGKKVGSPKAVSSVIPITLCTI